MTMDVLVAALLIFSLRIVDVSLPIVRILMVMRGRKALAWAFGFFQALVYILAIKEVMSDLGNWANTFAYAGGFATGNVVGIWLESKLAVGYGHIRIMSPRFGSALTERLRSAGFAVTVVSGRGRDGAVDILVMSVPRRQINRINAMIEEVDPNAFVTVENVRPLRKGFWVK